MSRANACISCGACCAYFRVSFHWSEQVSGGGSVPDHLTVPINQHLSCMKGTQSRPARCTALVGTIGEQVRCTIYEQRSTTCREFEMSGEAGRYNPECDKARAAWNLLPLVESDDDDRPNPMQPAA